MNVPGALRQACIVATVAASIAGAAAARVPHAAGAPCRPAGDVIDSPEALQSFEARVRTLAERMRPTVVAIVMLGADGNPKGTGSGTIISRDGWIVTAGHVSQHPGTAARVLLADGTELTATTAGAHFGPDGDVGLVKAEPGGRDLPFAPIGAAASLATGDPIIAFGHPLGPERTPWRPPPLRVGRVLGIDGWRLGIDAPLSPGDSGGPVFSMDGALVGVNSTASAVPELNTAATAETVVARMQAMREGLAGGEWLADPTKDPVQVAAAARQDEDGDEESSSVAALGSRLGRGQEHDARRSAVLSALAPLNDPLADSIVGVIVDSRDACVGVFVDAEGHVLTKASELGAGARRIDVVLNDGLSVQAKRLAVDQATDLAILGTSATGEKPVEFEDGPEPALGDAIVTVGRGISPLALGHRALGTYLSGRSDAASRGLLGVALHAPSDAERGAIAGGVGQVVKSVMPGSGAAAAGIAEGDAIVSIDGVRLDSAEAAAAPLGAHAPGDSVTVEWSHEGGLRTGRVRLLRPPWMDQRQAMSMGADLSRRATGFGEVIQHDGIVPAQVVGGPVVDSRGRVVGLNIARADRMKTYALPARRVRAAVEAMLGRIARGDVLPPDDPAAGLRAVEFAADGIAHLGARDANVLGPTNSVIAGDGAVPGTAAIAGWGDADDLAVWRLRLPAPGRYEVVLLCEPANGGKVDVFFGDDLMTVAVRGRPRDGRIRVGESVSTEAGDLTVRVQPLGRPSASVMRLLGLEVQRIDQLRLAESAVPILRWNDFGRLRREWEREQRRKERAGGTLGP